MSEKSDQKYFLITGSELGNLRTHQLPESSKREIVQRIIARTPEKIDYSWGWCVDCQVKRSESNILDNFSLWIKTEWVQAEIKEYKEVLKEQERKNE